MKKIYCSKCGRLLGELESGSRLRKADVFYLCADHWEQYKLLESINKPRDLGNLSSIFGDIFNPGHKNDIDAIFQEEDNYKERDDEYS